MSKDSLGLKRVEAVHYYVRDLERSRAFYTRKMGMVEVAQSSKDMEAEGKQRSAVFAAGDVVVVCSEPRGEGGRAWRYLRKHPDGIGTVIFEVEDAQKTLQLLEARGATPIDDVHTFDDGKGGKLSSFSITTPFGDSTFRFVQRQDFKGYYPGMELTGKSPKDGNQHSIGAIDHITSNFQTMSPALLWMEHVMGFERYWGIEFHTSDVVPDQKSGSGLKSTVMWDPKSGAKFANNEPKRPFFKQSQINIFNEDQRGDGIQHLALTVEDILTAVKNMREVGIQFMPTPGTYYDALPERIKTSGIGHIDEDIDELRKLGILLDGEAEHAYLLQIFLQDSAGLYRESEAGPFFYEIIQRKGDNGFGGGNFRALFESIERQQQAEGRI